MLWSHGATRAVPTVVRSDVVRTASDPNTIASIRAYYSTSM